MKRIPKSKGTIPIGRAVVFYAPHNLVLALEAECRKKRITEKELMQKILTERYQTQ